MKHGEKTEIPEHPHCAENVELPWLVKIDT